MIPTSSESTSISNLYEPLLSAEALDGASVHADEHDRDIVATIQELEASLERLDASIASARAESEPQATVDRDALRASIDASRKNLRNAIATCPFDILASIFVLVYEEFDSTRGPHGWDVMRIQCTLNLANVCRCWRRVALATPILWRYIAVSEVIPTFKNSTPFMQNLSRTIARSGTRSLDVVIDLPCQWQSSGVKMNAMTLAFWSKFFAQLIPAVSRLRELDVWTGSDFDTPELATFRTGLLTLLSCPTPVLENLYFDFQRRWPAGRGDEIVPGFLPAAPSLRRLQLSGVPFIPSLPCAVLSSLTYLSLGDEDIYLHHFWGTLSLAQNLESLHLIIAAATTMSDHIVRRPASLPIRELSAFGDIIMAEIFADPPPAMPNLRRLRTEEGIVTDFILTDALARSLAYLDLELYYWGDKEVRQDTLDHIRGMYALRDVSLHTGDIARENMLYDELCDPDEPMWPQLRALKLTQMSQGTTAKVRNKRRRRDGLLRLLRARNLNAPQVPALLTDATSTVAIKSVTFDLTAVPRWVAVQVKAILGDGCHCLDENGDELDDKDWAGENGDEVDEDENGDEVDEQEWEDDEDDDEDGEEDEEDSDGEEDEEDSDENEDEE